MTPQVDTKDAKWDMNTAGFYHSHKHGFGLLSAWRLVNAAKVWHSVPWLTSLESSTMKINTPILSDQRPTIATFRGLYMSISVFLYFPLLLEK